MDCTEVIKCIEDVLNSDYHYDETLGYQLTSDDLEWLEKAKGALKTQIPKPPILDTIYQSGIRSYKCPVCKKGSLVRTDLYYPKYCSNCGQALDWSDVE